MLFQSYISVFYVFYCVLSVHCAFIAHDRDEGTPCPTEIGMGRCVHVFRCLSTVLDLKAKEYPSICSFQSREPVVCCSDCELVNDTRHAIVDKEGGIFFRTGQKARDKCIEHLTYLPYSCQTRGVERLTDRDRSCYKFEETIKIAAVGGRDAERSEYPHMALLGFGDDEVSAQWLCGGSLISDKFILTAAHCLLGGALGPVNFVALGILKRSDPNKYWQIYKVKRAISHPQYKPPSKYHDIALLETDRTVVFSVDVFPACLDFEIDSKYSAYATGWGKLGKDRPLADTLQEVNVQEFSQEQCHQHYPPHRHLVKGYSHSMQMCYGDPTEPKDTCEGDSGGPLQVRSLTSRCLHSVIGVTSYGPACGYAGNAGMYTRVSHYVPWIESIVWPY